MGQACDTLLQNREAAIAELQTALQGKTDQLVIAEGVINQQKEVISKNQTRLKIWKFTGIGLGTLAIIEGLVIILLALLP